MSQSTDVVPSPVPRERRWQRLDTKRSATCATGASSPPAVESIIFVVAYVSLGAAGHPVVAVVLIVVTAINIALDRLLAESESDAVVRRIR